MLKNTIALIAFTFSFHASALDTGASSNVEPPKSSLTMVDPSVPPTSGGGGGGFVGSPKPIDTLPPVPVEGTKPIVTLPPVPVDGTKPIVTLPPVPVDRPVVNNPQPPVSPPRPTEPPIVKIPEQPLPPVRPIEPPYQSSCGYMKNLLNLRINSVDELRPLMALRNIDYDMLRKAQNRIYEMSMRASNEQDASMKTSLQNEITCFREVAEAAQANVNADMQAIAKLLNAPIVGPVKQISNLPPQSDGRSPASLAPDRSSPSLQQVRVSN